jgi:hypothetical protein
MKKILSRLMPHDVIVKRANKRVIMNFAEKVGLVYFGFVDQRSDEHQLIRGLTLSTNHRDNHYCVGSLYKYDVALVERTDTLHYPDKPTQIHHWLIMQFDLHSSKDLPHVFLGLHTHGATFYANLFAKFGQLQRAPLGTFGMYDESFTNKYAIYTPPAESLTVERLFDTEMTKLLAKHFGALTVEINDGCLYLYSEHNRVSKSLLEAMLQNGVWLARHIDERAELL